MENSNLEEPGDETTILKCTIRKHGDETSTGPYPMVAYCVNGTKYFGFVIRHNYSVNQIKFTTLL
jgi:hypothetical protein